MRTDEEQALGIASIVSEMLDGHAIETCPTPPELAGWIDTLLGRYGCDVRPTPDLAAHARFGRQVEEDWSASGTAERYGLRYALTMAETTYRRLLEPPPAVDPALLNEFQSLLAERPVALLSYFQGRIDPESSLRRALAIRRELGTGMHSVLFVGDDDTTSIALALIEPAWPLWVIDIDERVLEHLSHIAKRLDVALAVETVDIRLGVPRHLADRFSGVAIDPPRLFRPCLNFLRFSVACLSRVEPTRVFWSDHPDWTLGYAKIMDELPALGMRCLRIHHELHRYVHSAGGPGNLELLDERQQYFEVLEELSRAFRLDPRWLQALAVWTQPWSHLHVLGRSSGVAR